MKVAATTLTKREAVAAGTLAFHFDKPSGFSFNPRQAINLVLPCPPATKADSARHAFSLVNAPFQRDLVVATRLRDSAFKRTLTSLPPGLSDADRRTLRIAHAA